MAINRKKTRNKTAKWWDLSKRKEKSCERCGRKIKVGRYCYYCGKFKGLW